MPVPDILEHDHADLAKLLNEFASALRQSDVRHAHQLLDLFWARLAMHIRAENLRLFPAVLNGAREPNSQGSEVPRFADVAAIVETLRSDHNFFMDELATAVKTLRDLVSHDRQPEDPQLIEATRERVEAVARRLEAHNALEEEQVYRWPALLLTAADLENLISELKQELENSPPRFRQN